MAKGAAVLNNLQYGDKVLISEAYMHHHASAININEIKTRSFKNYTWLEMSLSFLGIFWFRLSLALTISSPQKFRLERIRVSILFRMKIVYRIISIFSVDIPRKTAI
jgi:hypothetical protein